MERAKTQGRDLLNSMKTSCGTKSKAGETERSANTSHTHLYHKLLTTHFESLYHKLWTPYEPLAMNFEPHLPHTLNPSTICFEPLYPKLGTSCHKFWMTHTLNLSTIHFEPPNHKLWTSLTQTLNPLDHKQWTMLNKHDIECWTHSKPQTLHPLSADSTENTFFSF